MEGGGERRGGMDGNEEGSGNKDSMCVCVSERERERANLCV